MFWRAINSDYKLSTLVGENTEPWTKSRAEKEDEMVSIIACALSAKISQKNNRMTRKTTGQKRS